MSIGVIATIRIQDGKAAEFETFASELAGQVRMTIVAGHIAYERTARKNN